MCAHWSCLQGDDPDLAYMSHAYLHKLLSSLLSHATSIEAIRDLRHAALALPPPSQQDSTPLPPPLGTLATGCPHKGPGWTREQCGGGRGEEISSAPGEGFSGVFGSGGGAVRERAPAGGGECSAVAVCGVCSGRALWLQHHGCLFEITLLPGMLCSPHCQHGPV